MAEENKDNWVPTVCYMCYAACGIMARQVDGVIADIKGHAENPNSLGKTCAKGKAGIMTLYDPCRIKAPLKRTNPDKGIGVDPRWVEISWEEALNLVTEKFKKIREKDPRRIAAAGLNFNESMWHETFESCLGVQSKGLRPADYFCGNVLHLLHYCMEGAFFVEPDYELCNYLLLIGSQEGFVVNKNPVRSALRMAQARERGMKLVVIDPICTNAGSKADEWIPIRPGTDGALALSMLNVLLNDLGICDREFIKKHTNGPFLVGADGQYVRDKETQNPLVWDVSGGGPKPYNAEDISGVALEGSYQVNGLEVVPSFQVLKEHVKKYSPEEASSITTVPADTIRRIAEEFGQAARIGSTIVIEGKELPYRPVAVSWTKGAECHKHGYMAGLALQLLKIVVGAVDVPGASLGNKTNDRTIKKRWGPKEGLDGLIVPGGAFDRGHPYPPRRAKKPETLQLWELMPVAHAADPLFEEGMLNPDKFQLEALPEAMLHVSSNFMMSTANPGRIAQVLKRIPFLVSIARYVDETVEFADLVLPEADFLESFVPFPNIAIGYIMGQGHWYRSMAQPVKAPFGQSKPMPEIVLELADRLGIRADLYQTLNVLLGLEPPYRLDPAKKYDLLDIGDRWAKSWFGPDHGVEWFRQNGVFVYAKREVEEVYPRPFISARIPLYQEHFLAVAEELQGVSRELNIDWDTSDYQPLPDWKPCPAYEERANSYDLYAVNYKAPFHAFSTTAQNPWLNELAEHHPYAYKVLISSQIADKKGIKDGEIIWVESHVGKVKGVAKLTECIHPEVIGIAGTLGHWADGMPVAKGKGVHFNTLLPSTLDSIDLVSGTLDACVRVKVSKA